MSDEAQADDNVLGNREVVGSIPTLGIHLFSA